MAYYATLTVESTGAHLLIRAPVQSVDTAATEHECRRAAAAV
jgi:hypothetical protein